MSATVLVSGEDLSDFKVALVIVFLSGVCIILPLRSNIKVLGLFKLLCFFKEDGVLTVREDGDDGEGEDGEGEDGDDFVGGERAGVNTTKGDSVDGDSSDGDSADGDSADGDSADGDSADGDSVDGDLGGASCANTDATFLFIKFFGVSEIWIGTTVVSGVSFLFLAMVVVDVVVLVLVLALVVESLSFSVESFDGELNISVLLSCLATSVTVVTFPFLCRFLAELALVLRSSCGVGAGGSCFAFSVLRFCALFSRGVIGGLMGGVLGGGKFLCLFFCVVDVVEVLGEFSHRSATSCGMTPKVEE
jgi:hypothetical protein